jgi:hypothetical protein
MSEIRISPFNYSKYTYTIKKKIKNSMDNKKKIRAFMPNLIHSLFAASLSILINNYFNNYNNKIKNIFGIHDCFSTTFLHGIYYRYIKTNLYFYLFRQEIS